MFGSLKALTNVQSILSIPPTPLSQRGKQIPPYPPFAKGGVYATTLADSPSLPKKGTLYAFPLFDKEGGGEIF
jgi:hypothetical protein